MIGLLPTAIGMVGGAGGAALLANPAVRAGLAVHNAHGAYHAIGSAADAVGTTVGPEKKKKQLSPGTLGNPMTRLASDLSAMAAQASAPELTTEVAAVKTDQHPSLPSEYVKSKVGGSLAQPRIDRGTHSTQLGSGDPLVDVAPGKTDARSFSTSPGGVAKVSESFIRPLWRGIKGGLEHIGNTIPKVAPYAAHAVTFGGAALTAKGLYDAVRAERERGEQQRLALTADQLQEERTTRFHEARMRMVDAATQHYQDTTALPPLTLDVQDPEGSAVMDPGTGDVYHRGSINTPHSLYDQTDITPLDVKSKLGYFNPRIPQVIAAPKPVPTGPSLLEQLDSLASTPLQRSIGERQINLVPAPTHALSI